MTDAVFEALYPGLTEARRREKAFVEYGLERGCKTPFAKSFIRDHYEGGCKQQREDSALILHALRAERARIMNGRQQ